MTNRSTTQHDQRSEEQDVVDQIVVDPLNSALPFAPKEPEQVTGKSTIVMGVNIAASPFPDRLTLSRLSGMNDPEMFKVFQEIADEARHNGVTLLSWDTTDASDYRGLSQLLTLVKDLDHFKDVAFVLIDDPENHLLQTATASALSVWSMDTLKLRVGSTGGKIDPMITKGLDQPAVSEESDDG